MDFVRIHELVFEFIDFAVQFVFSRLVLREVVLERVDGGPRFQFCRLEFRDTGFHQIVYEFEFHDSAAELFVGLAQRVELFGERGVHGLDVAFRRDKRTVRVMRREMTGRVHGKDGRKLWGAVTRGRGCTEETCWRGECS